MIKRCIFALLWLAVPFAVNSCVGEGPSSGVSAIFLNDSKITMDVGDIVELTVCVIPSGAVAEDLQWLSDDESVAAVSDGKITALSRGRTMITVSLGDFQDFCEVVVESSEYPEEHIVMDVQSVSLLPGESYELNAYVPDMEDGSISWQSSAPEVASVNGDGLITANAFGRAVISAVYGDESAECVATVLPQPQVGDYYYSDGSWSSELDKDKKVVGVVFWTGNPCEDDQILQEDCPNCVHGLVVSHCGDELTEWQGAWKAYDTTVCWWVNENLSGYAEMSCPIDGTSGNLNKILGYNNTKAMELFNEARENVWWPVTIVEKLVDFRSSNPAPAISSGWYIPSIKELSIMSFGDYDGNVGNTYPGRPSDRYEMLCGRLARIEGAVEFEPSDPYAETGYYWSSTEQTMVFAYDMPLDKGYVTSATKTSRKVRVRYILAF